MKVKTIYEYSKLCHDEKPIIRNSQDNIDHFSCNSSHNLRVTFICLFYNEEIDKISFALT